MDLWNHLQKAKKPIVLYGMGDGCDKILSVCEKKGIPISGIFASDEFVRGQRHQGFPVMRYREAKETFGDMIVLLAFGVFREEMLERIRSISQETEFYAPEVPLFGGGIFDEEYYHLHQRELEEVAEMLSDETSRKVFSHLLSFKLTGKITPLFAAETKKAEDLLSLVPFSPGDVYVDVGAYDGDTVLEWDRIHPDRGEILALEPNPKTFSKLMTNCAHLPAFRAYPLAAWNQRESLTFGGRSGRSTAVRPDGSVVVDGERLDRICQRADFIKFDVEGAEKEAISGAEALIRDQAPTLCVSAYHRTEDLFALPLQIKTLQPRYRVYLRHNPYVPAWDTQFYFVAR